MLATIKLEAIGDDAAQRAGGLRALGAAFAMPVRRPWVAEIVGQYSSGKFRRAFLDGHKDYSEANSVGSRGVYVYYHLREGRIYDVHELTSWKRSRRYFCTISDGQIVEMDADEVAAALSERADRDHV